MEKNITNEVNRVFDFIVNPPIGHRKWEELRKETLNDFNVIVNVLVELDAIIPRPCKSKWDRFEPLGIEE